MNETNKINHESFYLNTSNVTRNAFNLFPNKPWFLRVCSTSLLKTLLEKEKLLVKSNFSFSHSISYPSGELSVISIKFEIVVCKLVQFERVQNSSFGRWLMVQKVRDFDCRECFKNNVLCNFEGKKKNVAYNLKKIIVAAI